MGSTQAAAGFLLYSTTRRTADGEPRIFDTTSLSGGFTDIRAEPGRLTCLFPVEPRACNRNGTLHGGCAATLVDVVGTAALLTVAKKGGVSLSIATHYLSPIPSGGVCLVDAKVLRVGRQVATIEVSLRDAASGELAVQGTHVKFISEKEADLSQLAAAAKLPPPPPAPAPAAPPALRAKL